MRKKMLLEKILSAKQIIPSIWLPFELNITASLQYFNPKNLYESIPNSLFNSIEREFKLNKTMITRFKITGQVSNQILAGNKY